MAKNKAIIGYRKDGKERRKSIVKIIITAESDSVLTLRLLDQNDKAIKKEGDIDKKSLIIAAKGIDMEQARIVAIETIKALLMHVGNIPREEQINDSSTRIIFV